MEIKMLKGNSIWIRSEDNEIYLVGCDAEGNLYAQLTQPRLKPSDNNDLKKICFQCGGTGIMGNEENNAECDSCHGSGKSIIKS